MSERRASAATLRAGIVGARRVRQGLGPFVARDLSACGVAVDLVLGTTEETARAAADQVAEQLARTTGAPPPRWTADPDEFDAADLQVACVLSPAGTHEVHVERALAAGRHVLCEKPFLWEPEVRWSEAAADLEARFGAAGQILAVNTQWPWTLDAHRECTGPRAETVQRVEMGLSPASLGLQMIGDALPHPLSLAQALRPDLERLISVEVDVVGQAHLEVAALLEGGRGPLEVRASLVGTAAPGPREAWVAVDGRRAERVIDPADYSLSLRSGDALVPMPDPLTARIASFVDQILGERPCPWTRPGDLARRASMLEAAVVSHRAACP